MAFHGASSGYIMAAVSRVSLALILCFGSALAPVAWAGPGPNSQLPVPGSFVGWLTNGPGVYRLRCLSSQAMPGLPLSYCPPPAELPPEIRRVMLMFRASLNVTIFTNWEPVLDHFAANSLNNVIWTNFIAHTNGRSMKIWSVRARPIGWPLRAPVVKWNTNSLIWGLRGMTALCPSWQAEGPPGWAPITALSRRHGYTRGHAMGPDRVGASYAGMKVWFLTAQNSVVQTTVLREIVRIGETSARDYTLLLFSSDLPETIQPMRVVAENEVYSAGSCRYVYCSGGASPLFKTEQGGNVSADVPGFVVDTMKGGDSGSPNMLPLPGELAFWTGRTTSGASPEMQADMDTLCRLEGLDPRKYRLQWVDLSGYPKY